MKSGHGEREMQWGEKESGGQRETERAGVRGQEEREMAGRGTVIKAAYHHQ